MDNTQKLLEAAAGIRDAVLDGENTASRVGAMFVSIIQAMQHFPGQMVDASTIKFSNGKTATHITFNIIDSAGKTSAVDISVPAASSTSAGLLTPEKAEEYDAAVTDVAALKKRMPGAEKGLLLSGFRHGPTDQGVTFVFDAIGADGTIAQQQILVPLVSAGSPGVVTKAQMDAVGTKADDAKTAADAATQAAEYNWQAVQVAAKAAGNAYNAAVAAQDAANAADAKADAAKTAADGAAKGVRDINAVVGEPDGIATLGTDGKVPVEQVPALGYLPLTKVVGVAERTYIEQSVEGGYLPAGVYYVTDFDSDGPAFCHVRVEGDSVVFDDSNEAQPSEAALEGYFLETSTGKLWQMDAGELMEVPTRQALASKQDTIVASEDIVPQSGGKLTLTQKAKLALYNDMWDLLTNGYGGYKPKQAPDAAHPYLLNKLWLTYQEAVEVYLAWKMTPNDSKTRYFRNKSIRTTLPAFPTPSIYECDYTFTECLLLETVRINNISAGERTFYGCRKLRTINSVYTITTDNAFFGCESLEELTITGTQSKNVNLQWSPLISMASLNSIIQHANAAIVITVHPIVYAKLTDETNTEWNGVLSAAEAKNITFATTE